ncbi:MAG: Metalloendopeptidase [Oscillospiraceae bacterium]|jgi:murein DD-endopeptidase MepM/ murein hydrolase activator NlpD|nr:Metalloendopeptidase [Oscillospiraceae bacterium]
MARTGGNDTEEREDKNVSEPVSEAKVNMLFNDYMTKCIDILYHLSMSIGAQTKSIFSAVRKGFRFLRKLLRRLFKPKMRNFIRNTKNFLMVPFKSAASHVKSIVNGIGVVKRRMQEAKCQNRSCVGAMCTTLAKGAKNNSIIFKTILNYTAPVVCIIALIAVINYATTLTFAVQVTYNGAHLGSVSDESVFEQAETMMQQRIVYENGNKAVDSEPVFAVGIVEKQDVINEDRLADELIKTSNEDIAEAQGLYIDGKFEGSVKDKTVLSQTLENLLAPYKKDTNTNVSFMKDVQLKSGLYLTSSIVDEQKLVTMLTSDVTTEKKYTVKEGDTPTGVADKLNIHYADFKKLNPNVEKSFMPGDKVLIAAREPFLSVKETKKQTYTQAVDFKTVEKVDKDYLKGFSKVTQKGVKGQLKVIANVEYVNGVEVGREIIETTTLKAPVEEKVTKGGKDPSSVLAVSRGASVSIKNAGMFIWPVGGGYTSSPYGGARRHKGTDIAAPLGTPVYAAAPGRVVMAKYYSGYGKCIIIDHGNGVQTLYGHCSSLFVSPGEYVKQGDNIGLVGRTGQATGNHCHFEVRINGSAVNPENYIGRRGR